MAGYSKGIVDTRKFNKDSKAKLGRGGDTKIREVDNKESHVNALEAYLIDVNNKAGEDYAKRVGAGTTNPQEELAAIVDRTDRVSNANRDAQLLINEMNQPGPVGQWIGDKVAQGLSAVIQELKK